MQKVLFVFFCSIFLFFSFGTNIQAQTLDIDNPFQHLETNLGLQRPPQVRQTERSSNIKDIQVFGEKSGVAFTNDSLFRTDDNGETWREIVLPKKIFQIVSKTYFFNEQEGLVFLADKKSVTLEILRTNDGGKSWISQPMNLRSEDLSETGLENITLYFRNEDKGFLRLRLSSSSNFTRSAVYKTLDKGLTWSFLGSSTQKSTDSFANIDQTERLKFKDKIGLANDEDITGLSIRKVKSVWILTSTGNCEGFKNGCTQTTKIYDPSNNSLKEITPPQIKELSRIEKEKAKLTANNSVFAQPPNGTTRISLNRGFDKCTAATSAQMQTWWNNSPFYDVNIYIGGSNRGCSQPQLTQTWVNTVSAQGWGLIPTWVGPQAPCTTCTTCGKHSADVPTAETEGRAQADLAIAALNNLGMTQGSIVYYDMERYADTGCGDAVKSFLKGWTDRLKELGYKSGTYGSPFNANIDWINIAPQSQMDAVWLARWNNVMSVWGVAPLPDTFWTNHQRIHQWLGPRDETWGGVTFNIDNNISDAPVASAAIAKNKPADFDGDGKTDISVWRPETGVWYVANSSNASYTILTFGLSNDVLAPGDFDGDGKTDFAVWRPNDGVWHLYSRSIYRSYQFGINGDIPVAADYDGDGRTDIAVFRPSTGVWYIANSFDSRGTSFRIEQFGLSGDKPVPGDYDGDGKTDLAVFRPSDGNWYLLQSTAGFASVHFGQNGDQPVQADYDGDGKTDPGIFRNGVWYLFQSQAGVFVTQFGLANDKPVVGDYDGDNKSDIAVFRPGTSVWYILQTQAGINITQFGIATDNPVPAAYAP
ncbi:MAG: glycoside hydrolase domain-containing protein [Actinomycetota bacterium]